MASVLQVNDHIDDNYNMLESMLIKKKKTRYPENTGGEGVSIFALFSLQFSKLGLLEKHFMI
jgi:hypothetical protein